MVTERDHTGDVCDQASAVEEIILAEALSRRKPEGPKETGFCLNCGPDVPLPAGHRWCDAKCRDDHQRGARR